MPASQVSVSLPRHTCSGARHAVLHFSDNFFAFAYLSTFSVYLFFLLAMIPAFPAILA